MKLVVIDTNVWVAALGGAESFDGTDGGTFPIADSTKEARHAVVAALKNEQVTVVLSHAVTCELKKLAADTFGYSRQGADELAARLRTFVTAKGGIVDTVGQNVTWETWRKAFVGQHWPTGPADAAVLYTAQRLGADLVTYDEAFSFELNVLGRGRGVNAIHPRELAEQVSELQPV